MSHRHRGIDGDAASGTGETDYVQWRLAPVVGRELDSLSQSRAGWAPFRSGRSPCGPASPLRPIDRRTEISAGRMQLRVESLELRVEFSERSAEKFDQSAGGTNWSCSGLSALGSSLNRSGSKENVSPVFLRGLRAPVETNHASPMFTLPLRFAVSGLAATAFAVLPIAAQPANPVVREGVTEKISDHVHVIP